jgi:hypothetical protein
MWQVTINYKYAVEEDSNTIFVREIEDLQSIVERGPDFRNIKNIEIVYDPDSRNRMEAELLTITDADAQALAKALLLGVATWSSGQGLDCEQSKALLKASMEEVLSGHGEAFMKFRQHHQEIWNEPLLASEASS